VNQYMDLEVEVFGTTDLYCVICSPVWGRRCARWDLVGWRFRQGAALQRAAAVVLQRAWRQTLKLRGVHCCEVHFLCHCESGEFELEA